MNKKLAVVGICIAVGFIMLFTTAFSSMAGSSGYDIYKSAVKNTVTVKNATGSFEMTVKDNGNTLLTLNTAMKGDRNSKSASGNVYMKADGQEKNIELYSQDEKTVVKDSTSDVYNVMEPHMNGNSLTHRESSDPEALKTGEMIVDALVGNLKDYVIADSKADGSSIVTVQLSGNQIPAVVNAVASLAIKNAAKEGIKPHMSDMPTDFNFKINSPKLVEDIRVDSVDVTAGINKDNVIEKQAVNINMSGKDANGVVHEIVINMNMGLSDFNNSNPEKIDLTGKQVKTIQPKKPENR